MFRRSAYDAVDGFDESLIAEDRDFYVRIAAAGYTFSYLAEPLVCKREHSSNLSRNVRGCHLAHLATLDKFNNSLDPVVYKHFLYKAYLRYGRLAAGNDQRFEAVSAFWYAARIGRSIVPLVECARRVARATTLSIIPSEGRVKLRRLRRQLLRPSA
jgi:GT2 family glycosyltransferase